MSKPILTLLNVPGGFDVFIKQDEWAPEELAAQHPIIEPPARFVFRRQPQFVGSSEVIFAINGERQPEVETGENTKKITYWLASALDAKIPFRLVTVSERFPKK